MIAVSLSHINNTNEMYKRMVGLCRANDRYVDTLDSPTDALLLTWKLNVDRRGVCHSERWNGQDLFPLFSFSSILHLPCC